MPSRQPSSSPRKTSIAYHVEPTDLHGHLYSVTLRIAAPVKNQQLALPVWIPGSYLVREFAKHLQGLQAEQKARTVNIEQLDKCTWQVACQAGQALTLRYQVYAHDDSVRSAWLDTQRGFFNATSLCLRVLGQSDVPHQLELIAPTLPAKARPWRVATALKPGKIDAQGFGHYLARHYDELADCPVELGDFWQGEFEAAGVRHRLVVAGAPPSFDAARLLADTQTACESVIAFWYGPGATAKQVPFTQYLFMLNAVDDGYGGLEHASSTALICTRKDLPRTALAPSKASEGYTTLLGLICHEYFHAWNVKRLRPNHFASYQYQSENYTDLLWFFEGFTSYYDDLLLRRVGLIDDTNYMRLLNKTINQVQQAPGRHIQSLAQASFDAWLKYYRPDANTPNATISYYSKGALVALCLDLTLRAEGQTTLDAVMRHLWKTSGAQQAQVGGLLPAKGCITEADFAAALQALGKRSFAHEIAQWIHGTGELPLQRLLQGNGVRIHDDPAQLAQQLGLRVSDSAGSLQIKTVLRGGWAERAGMAPGDEWLAIEVAGQGWRLSRLDDLLLYAPAKKSAAKAGKAKTPPLSALLSRDKRLLRLSIELPQAATELPQAGAATSWRLAVADSTLLQTWTAPGTA
jgi:predicted metalloprotease with PDZ domain